MATFDYHRPDSLTDALRLKGELPGARFIAGGTDLMVRVRERALRPPALISLARIAGLRRLSVGDPTRLGAMVRVADIARSPELRHAYPSLVQAALRLGSVQVRNRATVAGNLCNASPCADLAPPLLVHEARVHVTSDEGERVVPLLDFFVAPGETRVSPTELVTEVVVDAPPPGARTVFYKHGRVRMDISIASVCVLVVIEDGRCSKARIAAGSVAPRPVRLPDTEAALLGRSLDDEVIGEARRTAAAEVAPIDDTRSTSAYRRHLVGVLVERAVRSLRDGGER
jgi:carbon-monoxide dehydrogenase medium subunit